MSMILNNFLTDLLKITKTQNFFKKIFMPIKFNNFWGPGRSSFFLWKTALAPWAKSYQREGVKISAQ
jgi:hypothetical protein